MNVKQYKYQPSGTYEESTLDHTTKRTMFMLHSAASRIDLLTNLIFEQKDVHFLC